MLDPDHFLSRLGLAVLASAGIFYANISPVIVSAFAQGSNFTGETAGYIFSINMYGNAFGALAMSFAVVGLEWRRTAMFLLVVLISLDLLSMTLVSPIYLYSARLVHGLTGGSLVALIFAVIARTRNPERTQAFTIMLQLFLGGILALTLTPLIPTYGTSIIWMSLIAFYLVAFSLLPFLGDYPVVKKELKIKGNFTGAGWVLVSLTMLAYFMFQSGQMAAFTYIIEVGLNHAFDFQSTSRAVAMGLWVGGPAALLVNWWSIRTGRLIPIILASSLQIVAVGILLIPSQYWFLAANIGFGIFFSIAHPYVLGVASELDNTGKMAALAAFAGALGLATGPFIAGVLVGEGYYDRVIQFSVLALITSLLLISIPARVLDIKNRTQRVIWS